MWLLSEDFRAVFWIAVIPAFLAVALLVIAVREPERLAELRRVRAPLHRDELRCLGAGYWWIVAFAALFTLARFSEAFLILRAESIGLPLVLVPTVLVVMSLAYSLSAYPVGVLSDRMNRRSILAAGLVFLLLADLVLAFAGNLWWVGIGVLLWGLHMGFTQGILAAMVAETSPPKLRGTAFGMFNLVIGVALLVASIVAGLLWDLAGPRAAFLSGAAFAMLTLIGSLAFRGIGKGRRLR